MAATNEKPQLEVFYQGMSASGSLVKTPPEKAIWLENVTINQDQAKKRLGYNLLGYSPVRSCLAKPATPLSGTKLYLEALWVADVQCSLSYYEPNHGWGRHINNLLPLYVQSISSNIHTVIAKFTNVPETLLFTEETIVKFGDEWYTPVAVLYQGKTEVVALFSFAVVNRLGIGEHQIRECNLYPIGTVGVYRGPTLSYLDYRSISSIRLDHGDAKKLKVLLNSGTTLDYPVGTVVYFDSGCWSGSSQFTAKPQYGEITLNQGDYIEIEVDSVVQDWQVPEFTTFAGEKVLDHNFAKFFICPSTIRVDSTFEETYPIGCNALYVLGTYQTSPKVIYGLPISGYPLKLLASLETDNGVKTIAADSVNFYELEKIGTFEPVSGNTPSIVTPSKVLLATEGVITLPIDVTPYKKGDEVLLMSQDLYGNVHTVTLVVKEVGTDHLKLIGQNELTVYRDHVVHYKRTSNQITLKNHKLTVGDLVTLDRGNNYEVISIQGNTITLDTAVTYSSFDTVSCYTNLTPNTKADSGSLVPLYKSDYPQDALPFSSVSFLHSIVYGNRRNYPMIYDGVRVTKLCPPTPPTPCFVRSVPGSTGYIPTKKDSKNKPIAPTVDIVITYAWYDSRGTLFESPITPEEDLRIIPKVSSVNDNYCEVIEIAVRSVPRGLGYPDNIEIRAYKTVEGESRLLMTLDSAVPNNPDVDYQILLIGAVPEDLSDTSSYRLYTVEKLGENFRDNNTYGLMPRVLGVGLDRLWAGGGIEKCYWGLTAKSVYDKYTSEFTGWLELSKGNTTLRTVTLTVKPDLTGFEVGSKDSWLTDPAYVVPAFYPFMDSLLKKEVSQVTYRNLSRGCTIQLGVTPSGISEGDHIYLRTSGDFVSKVYPIDFNGRFKVESLGSTSVLVSSIEGSWSIDFAQVSSISGAGRLFKKHKAYPEYAVGPTRLALVLAHIGDAVDAKVEVSIRVKQGESDWWSVCLNKFVVIAGLGTRGNFRVQGSSNRLTWEKDLIWKVTGATTISSSEPLFPSGTKISLQPYLMGPSGPYAITLDKSFSQISSELSDYPIEIFLAPATDTFSTVDGLGVPDDCCTVVMSNHGYSVNDLVSFTFKDTLKVGIPKLSTGIVTEVIDVNTFKVSSPTEPTANYGNTIQTFTSGKAYGIKVLGSSPSLFSTPVLGVLRVYVSADVSVGDYVFLLTRGFDDESVCGQLTGYFKVVGKDTDYIDLQFNDEIIKSGVSSVWFGGVLAIKGTSDARFVPIPVAPTIAASRSLADPVLPLFSNKKILVPLNQVIKRIALAFNSVFKDVAFCYFGGRVAGLEPYPANGLICISHGYPENKFDIGHEDTFRIKASESYSIEAYDELQGLVVNKELTTSPFVFSFKKNYRESRIYWTETFGQKVRKGGVYPQFKATYYHDLVSSDDDYITCMVQFQESLIVFKRFSCFRLMFNEEGVLVSNLIGRVGAYVAVSTPNVVYFANDNGAFRTDGVKIESIQELRGYWVDAWGDWDNAVGIYDPKNTEVYLAIPWKGRVGVFKYNETWNAWSFDTIRPLRVTYTNGQLAYIEDDKLYQIHKPTDEAPYYDGDEPVEAVIRTRFANADAIGKLKFVNQLIFGFEGEGKVICGLATNYSLDYNKIREFELKPKGFGVSAFGRSYYGTVGIVDNLKVMPNPVRGLSFSVELRHKDPTEFTLDSMVIEGFNVSSKLVPNATN